MGDAGEKSDSHLYEYVTFTTQTVRFFRSCIAFVEVLVAADLAAVDFDPALKGLLDEEDRKGLPIERLRRDLTRCGEWLDKTLGEKADPVGEYEVNLTHGRVRLLKASVKLYLNHLRAKRNQVASRPNLSRHVLEAIDRKITEKEELLERGVFANASPVPLLADDALTESVSSESTPAPPDAVENLSSTRRPRPVVLSTVEILDPDLRRRCLDLLEQFRQGGDTERLDTVVAEASRVLEDRLRKRSGAPATCVGPNLASFAFGSTTPKLVLSATAAEQEGALAMFRGVFGFIRNHVQHHLVATITPDRALQIVALIDYLLFLIDEAKSGSPTTGGV